WGAPRGASGPRGGGSSGPGPPVRAHEPRSQWGPGWSGPRQRASAAVGAVSPNEPGAGAKRAQWPWDILAEATGVVPWSRRGGHGHPTSVPERTQRPRRGTKPSEWTVEAGSTA